VSTIYIGRKKTSLTAGTLCEMGGGRNLNKNIIENSSIVDQKHWDMSYEKQILGVVSENDPIRELIVRNIPHGKYGDRCIEIGAYPCRYLSIFGELGYEINGIDTTEKIESDELKAWLAQNNWNYNVLQKKNFLEFDTQDIFNIVCSFGFIKT
jgi:hypothetical protein